MFFAIRALLPAAELLILMLMPSCQRCADARHFMMLPRFRFSITP
jgi:hypothetical protein